MERMPIRKHCVTHELMDDTLMSFNDLAHQTQMTTEHVGNYLRLQANPRDRGPDVGQHDRADTGKRFRRSTHFAAPTMPV
jgi:hypothetical protein